MHLIHPLVQGGDGGGLVHAALVHVDEVLSDEAADQSELSTAAVRQSQLT